MFTFYEPINYLLTEEMGVNKEITTIARAIEQDIKTQIQQNVLNNKNNLNYNLLNGDYKYREFVITTTVNIPTILSGNVLFPFDNIYTVLLLHVYENNDKIKNPMLGYYTPPKSGIYLSNKKQNQGDIKLFYNANIKTLDQDIENLYPAIDHELIHGLQVVLINQHKQKTNKTNSNTSYEYNKNTQINTILQSDKMLNLDMNFPMVEYYLNNHEMEARVQQLAREIQNIYPHNNFDKNKELYNNSSVIREYNNIIRYGYVNEYNTLFDDEKETFINILNEYNKTNKTSYGFKSQKDLTQETIIPFLKKLDKIKDIKLSNLKRNFDKLFTSQLIKEEPISIALREWLNRGNEKLKYTKQEVDKLRNYYKSLRLEYKPNKITVNDDRYNQIVAEIIYEEFNESIGYFGNDINENYYNKNIKSKIIKLEYLTEDTPLKNILIKRLTEHLKNKGYEQIIIPYNIHISKIESIKNKTIKLTNDYKLLNL